MINFNFVRLVMFEKYFIYDINLLSNGYLYIPVKKKVKQNYLKLNH